MTDHCDACRDGDCPRCDIFTCSCSHDGSLAKFDWSRMHYGICPKCCEDKFIGHGPLCVDCYLGGSGDS